jgi:hypothetical protein
LDSAHSLFANKQEGLLQRTNVAEGMLFIYLVSPSYERLFTMDLLIHLSDVEATNNARDNVCKQDCFHPGNFHPSTYQSRPFYCSGITFSRKLYSA